MFDYQPYFWSPPARLPEDLPAHEQWQRSMPFKMHGTPSQHPPQTAPGFARAWRMGLLPPPMPTTPPEVLPGIGSVLGLALGLVVGIGPTIVLVQVLLPALGEGSVVAMIAVATAVAQMAVLLKTMKRFKARMDAEHEAGYTMLAAQTGLWAINPFTNKPWRAPDRTVLPSGWYPSPYFPGIMQRWDGPDWAPLGQHWWRAQNIGDVFRLPETDFLGVGNLRPGAPLPQ